MTKDIAKLLKKALKFQVSVGLATITGSSEGELPVFTAPCAGRVTKLGYVLAVAIVGSDDACCTLGFKDKGAAGAGTDIMAQLQYVSEVDGTAFDFKDLGTVSYRDLAKGDVVTFFKVASGSMAMPALVAHVEFQPDLTHGD